MKKLSIKLLLLFCCLGLTLNTLAVELKARVTREEFAEFYGTLIIEEIFTELNLDDIFTSNFDMAAGTLRRDDLFSVRSPYFEPNILKKAENPKPPMQKQGKNKERPEDNIIQNIKLNEREELQKNTFKIKLNAANKIIDTGKNFDQAKSILDSLRDEAGDNNVNLTNIAKLYLKIDENNTAIELLKKATDLEPNDHKILYTYAIALYKNDELNLAEINLSQITKIKPDFMYAHYNLGNLYYKKKEYKKAIDSFKQAMKLAPDKSDIYFNIAITLEQLGYKDMAVKFYQKCLELNPADDEAYKALQRLTE